MWPARTIRGYPRQLHQVTFPVPHGSHSVSSLLRSSNSIDDLIFSIKYDTSNTMVMSGISWSGVNSSYEYENKSHLIKYYHAILRSDPRLTLTVTDRAGYFQGCPGLTQDTINKFTSIKDASKMRHMRKTPTWVQSTTRVSKRG